MARVVHILLWGEKYVQGKEPANWWCYLHRQVEIRNRTGISPRRCKIKLITKKSKKGSTSRSLSLQLSTLINGAIEIDHITPDGTGYMYHTHIVFFHR